MNSYEVSDIKPDQRFNSNLLIDNRFLLCVANTPISQQTLKALVDWGFKTLITDNNVVQKNTAAPQPTPGPQAKFETVNVDENLNEIPAIPASRQSTELKNLLEEAKGTNDSKDTSKMAAAEKVYAILSNYITYVYTRYATHKQLNLNELSDTVKEIILFMRNYGTYMLRVQPISSRDNRDFLIMHSERSLFLSIMIGFQLRMPIEKLIELGVTTILHEIGMISLPSQLYLSDRQLTPAEKSQMSTHPIIGYNILKDAKFPLSIQLGVLEHHERETGTGYPRKISGEKISLYAKIIAVTCAFEGITSPRKFKEAKSTFEAMVEMVQNKNNDFDGTVIKALLNSVSLYTIGSYVYLSNGKIGQVIEAVSGTPKSPIVNLVGEKQADGEPIRMPTNDTTCRIVRIMNPKEVEDVLKSLS